MSFSSSGLGDTRTVHMFYDDDDDDGGGGSGGCERCTYERPEDG
jgi:hypothetical protein